MLLILAYVLLFVCMVVLYEGGIRLRNSNDPAVIRTRVPTFVVLALVSAVSLSFGYHYPTLGVVMFLLGFALGKRYRR